MLLVWGRLVWAELRCKRANLLKMSLFPPSVCSTPSSSPFLFHAMCVCAFFFRFNYKIKSWITFMNCKMMKTLGFEREGIGNRKKGRMSLGKVIE
ncbi:hypothetical protein K450DRAFT_239448 [Umbelopsis ramanniana AG]|uniref:Uncharacterized protein n=1 Tax=Umbelopsis ramanniana AG TaxID=1314678 RepID=A0AAD5HEI5_UMBRA|nr:uncharacterized protein K450DRAFT_239448 [Umbelopsis ramanniana AG]KAI8580109.1 hypothetical protein K450DRAFT_239448 [Umbelopsis ramanniana AG]